MADWDEGKHPRGPGGEWAHLPGFGGGPGSFEHIRSIESLADEIDTSDKAGGQGSSTAAAALRNVAKAVAQRQMDVARTHMAVALREARREKLGPGHLQRLREIAASLDKVPSGVRLEPGMDITRPGAPAPRALQVRKRKGIGYFPERALQGAAEVAAKGNAETLKQYWAHGEGAAKIRWGTGGDYDRCVRLVTEETKGAGLDVHGYCANLHHDALGIWPATHAHLVREGKMTAARGDPALIPALVTIPGVDILAAGRWALSSGDQEFTPANLREAVAASECPSVGPPVIKIGHVDPRFDGEPALGRVRNMRLAAAGNKITGDLAGMPGWLGAVAASAYPRRSVEGMFGFACQQGHVHPFVITGLALLGVTPPGVGVLGGLPDVAALYGVTASTPPHGTAWAVEAGGEMGDAVAAAAISEADVRRAFYENPEVPQTRWITELQMDPAQLIVADESDSKVYRVPFRIEAGRVAFGTAVEVSVQYADLAAMRGTGPMVAYASAAVSRAVPPVVVADAPPGPGDGKGGLDGGGGGDDPDPGPGDGADEDGLDASWEDLADLGDVAGLTVEDLEAELAAEEGRAPEPATAKAPKLGTGARFAALKSKLAGKGVKNPGALAAFIGRKKFGKAKFHKLATAARKRKAKTAAAGGIEVDAAGRHGAYDGTHAHPHAALGGQGSDMTHDHSHAHKGDATHAHVHAAGRTGGGTEVDFTDDQMTALREALGLGEDDELTEDALVQATGALREKADAKIAASGRAPLPPGVITVSQEAWDSMTKEVDKGKEFRASVQRGERDQVIDAAIHAGKFSNAQRKMWQRVWERDPDGTRAVLASLKANVVPVEDIGTPGLEDDLTPDEFAALFPPGYTSQAPNGVMGGTAATGR